MVDVTFSSSLNISESIFCADAVCASNLDSFAVSILTIFCLCLDWLSDCVITYSFASVVTSTVAKFSSDDLGSVTFTETYKFKDTLVHGVAPGTTVEEFRKKFLTEGNVTVEITEGKARDGTELICSGDRLIVVSTTGKEFGIYSVSVLGDIDKDGNPLTYLDIISTEETIEKDLDLKVYYEKIKELVETSLPPREKQIIILRYGLNGYQPRTQREVAKYLGISRSYVSRIEKKALERMKEGFGGVIPTFED